MRCTLLAIGVCAVLSLGWGLKAAHGDSGTEPGTPSAKTIPPLPEIGDAADHARVLFDAIVRGDPDSALSFFLPRAAFAAIKAAANPNAIYDGLVRAYQRDIITLHSKTPDLAQASFVRLELSQRRSWVEPGEEANRLPYWAQRHNWLVYRVGNEQRRLELRVLISWQGAWYVTHLSEFKHPAPSAPAPLTR